MAMRVPIYMVVKGSGQFGPDNVEYQMILDVKLSRACADMVAQQYEGAKVHKMIADKEVSLPSF